MKHHETHSCHLMSIPERSMWCMCHSQWYLSDSALPCAEECKAAPGLSPSANIDSPIKVQTKHNATTFTTIINYPMIRNCPSYPAAFHTSNCTSHQSHHLVSRIILHLEPWQHAGLHWNSMPTIKTWQVMTSWLCLSLKKLLPKKWRSKNFHTIPQVHCLITHDQASS